MLSIDDDLKGFIPNYPIHVIDMGHENYDFHVQSLKELSHILQAVYSKTLPTDKTEVSNSILNLAGILSGSQKLYGKRKGGKTIMCNALQEMIDEGTAKATLKLLIELVQEGLLSVSDAARKAKLSEEDFKFAMNKQ